MKTTSIFAVLVSLVVATQASPMYFDKRRFGVEHTPEADKTFQDVKDIAQGTDKEAQAGNLSGAMVRALLAKAPACDQQDRADEVIDLGRELGGDKEEQLIAVAKTYRQLERNTPNAGQPSELCKKPPRNSELDGLVQAQDPTGKGKENPKGEDDPEEPKANPKNNPKENPKGEDDPEEKPKGNPKGKNPKGKGKDNPKENPKGEDDPEENPKGNPKGKNPKGKGKDNPKENPKGEDDPEENPKGEDDPEENPKNPEGGDNIAETNPVGGVKMPKIEQKDGDFIVNGNGFNGNLEAAQQRQCDVQRNLCFNAFNAGDRSFSTQDCDDQANACKEGPPVFA